MSFNSKKNIDHELLRRYYNGELSAAQRNALEQKALEDPFLKDAMDGFDQNPGDFEKYYQRHKKALSAKRGFTLALGIIALVGLFIVTLVLKEFTPSQIETIAENSTNDSVKTAGDYFNDKLEKIPEELDTLQVANTEDVISYKEIVNNKKEIEKQKEQPTTDTVQTVTDNTVINIEDSVALDNNFKLIEEPFGSPKKQAIPSIYLYDLYTVDYRELRNAQQNVRYKKMEFGGTAANRENDETSETDFVEVEVEMPYFIYLKKSMESFADDNYKRALTRYLTILEQYPEDLNALFYGGLCYFNLSKYEKAATLFGRVQQVDLEGFKEEALWYHAKSLIKLNRSAEARLLLDKIIINGGFYTKEAILLKKKI